MWRIVAPGDPNSSTMAVTYFKLPWEKNSGMHSQRSVMASPEMRFD